MVLFVCVFFFVGFGFSVFIIIIMCLNKQYITFAVGCCCTVDAHRITAEEKKRKKNDGKKSSNDTCEQ